MTVRILPTPPDSGSVQERRYEAFGFCTWVEFTPKHNPPWVGVFGHQGASSHSEVIRYPCGEHAFVIARGVGWIVSIEDGKLRFKTQQDCLVTATACPDKPYVVAADFTNIHVYRIDSHIWSSDRIALDGIRFDTKGKSFGRCWQADGWYGFDIQDDPWTVVRGQFLTSKW